MQLHAAESTGFPTTNPPVTLVMIERLVRDFCARTQKDPVLAPVLSKAIGRDWDSLMRRIRRFWAAEFLEDSRGQGDPVPMHASMKELRPAHLDRGLELFRQSAFGVCDRQSAFAFVIRAERITEQFKYSIFKQAGLTAPSKLRAAVQEVRP